MDKKKFIINEYIQFYTHLALLIFGGISIVLIAQSTSSLLENPTMWITIMIVLLFTVVVLTGYQINRVILYRKHFLHNPEVTIWKTITTLVCYPIDVVFYVIVLIALI